MTKELRMVLERWLKEKKNLEENIEKITRRIYKKERGKPMLCSYQEGLKELRIKWKKY